jgi:hypothetical protein
MYLLTEPGPGRGLAIFIVFITAIPTIIFILRSLFNALDEPPKRQYVHPDDKYWDQSKGTYRHKRTHKPCD